MKVNCPDCRTRFELNINEYDEGDYVNCPECNLELTVIVKNGKRKLKTAREKDFEEEEFGEFYEE